MSVTSVEKDFENLTLTLIADFDAPVERVWQLWVSSVDAPKALEFVDGFADQDGNPIDALLAG